MSHQIQETITFPSKQAKAMAWLRATHSLALPLLERIINPNTSRFPTDLRLSALSLEILGYLKSRECAGDTLTGIAEWWLMRQRIEVMTKNVKRALDKLVESGLVLRTARLGQEAVYNLNTKARRSGRSWRENAPARKETKADGTRDKS